MTQIKVEESIEFRGLLFVPHRSLCDRDGTLNKRINIKLYVRHWFIMMGPTSERL